MLITEFQEMEENDARCHSDVKQGHRLVERNEECLCSDSLRHSILNEVGQTALFVKKVQGETQIDDCRRSETRQTGSFIVKPREEPQRENQRDDGGHHLEKGRVAMLVDQEKIRPPLEVLRHGVLNKRVDTMVSDERVNVRTLSQGQLGLNNDDDRCLPGKNVNEQRTAYSTPSQTHEMGNVPISQHPTCFKMHNKIFYGPLMAVNSFQ